MTTLFTLLLAALSYFFHLPLHLPENLFFFVIFSIPFAFILGYPLFSIALDQASSRITPKLISSLRHDKAIHALTQIMMFFPFGGLLLFSLNPDPIALFIYLAIGVDIALLLMRKKSSYIDPFRYLEKLDQEGRHNAAINDERAFCGSLGGMNEIAEKSLKNGAISLSLAAIQTQERSIREFFSIKMLPGQVTTEPSTQFDYLSYTLFFLFQRQEELFHLAMDLRTETVLSHLIASFGKTALSAADLDYSLIASPIRHLGKCAKKATDNGFPDVGIRGVLTLEEVGKDIARRPQSAFNNLREPFFTLFSELENLAKDIFRKDKTIEIALLTQPFVQLREIFSAPVYKDHPDKEAILQRLNQILAEFLALESVMRTLPPLPTFDQEGKDKEPSLSATPS